MSRQNHDDLHYDWHKVADWVHDMTCEMGDLWIDLVVKASECPNDTGEQLALLDLSKRLKEACDKMDGLAYLCRPQSEWLGGNKSVVRVPHIVDEANKKKT